jgi:hypothetical protein
VGGPSFKLQIGDWLLTYFLAKNTIKSQISSTPPERWRAGKFQIKLKSQFFNNQNAVWDFKFGSLRFI